ncbi:hypothetical protein CEE37_09780 [candidate division LCP-89 bacterium B3_LCP]|uniref:Histidine kinase domain-containing protein n=1 Tax=candidate division LCP-89 bacterium B3_LCP TaxID=2012998 RepID=A0A532UYL5_UNCL8|nr:MAG: hypothetical protein CEE37_09780 [candidate division LCP-89 bacterium B3_LCP]
MSDNPWPFKPDHITNDREDILKGTGIISSNHLKGILTPLANQIEKPVSMMEFPVNSKEMPFRTRITTHDYQESAACMKFRYETDGVHCSRVENKIANLFRNLSESKFNVQIHERIKQSKELDKFYEDKDFQFVITRYESRIIGITNCPILGYSVLVFPVFFQKRVIGIIYVGQLCPDYRLEAIERIQKKAIKKYGNEIPDILSLHKKWVKNNRPVLSGALFNRLKRIAVNDVKKMEDILEKENEKQIQEYITFVVRRSIRDFHQGILSLKAENRTGDEGLKNLWAIVSERIEKIRSGFQVRNIHIFGTITDQKDMPTKLPIAASAGVLPNKLRNSIEEINYNLDKIPEDMSADRLHSVKYPMILEGIPGLSTDDKCNNFIRILPASPSPLSTIVIWIGFDTKIWNPNNPEDKYRGWEIDRNMQILYSLVATTHSSILAATAKNNLERALRIFGHELGQLTAGLDWLRLTYLSSVEKMQKLSADKLQVINRDVDGYLKQTHFLSTQARMSLEIPKPSKTEFHAFGEFLFKWKHTYRMEAEKKSLWFDLNYPEADDPERPPVYADPILLEQLVYNLLNNAVKYCHRGTNILIDCRKQATHPSSPHILTVTNFGIKIEEGEAPYRLYYRSSDVSGEEGQGIGLYLAKQIATSHGGSIGHSCTEISPYNVPLIRAYIDEEFDGNDGELADLLIKNYNELNKFNEYDEVVAKYFKTKTIRYSKPTIGTLKSSINEPTYKVTFTVTIPAKMKEKK